MTGADLRHTKRILSYLLITYINTIIKNVLIPILTLFSWIHIKLEGSGDSLIAEVSEQHMFSNVYSQFSIMQLSNLSYSAVDVSRFLRLQVLNCYFHIPNNNNNIMLYFRKIDPRIKSIKQHRSETVNILKNKKHKCYNKVAPNFPKLKLVRKF